ncbi:hypothetical protein SteCoe_25527 [Stentor coeruleus]|uniref:Protein kinase domain-containing protein n=1 Tax=Stentor coeruleus TaxID=5963 RepID=A0A1R2BEZ4_9CILI|nr:hypothetical protein SteCoe_25527 [Stentor coeruleus]
MGCMIAHSQRNSSKRICVIYSSPMRLRPLVSENIKISRLSDYVSLNFLGVGAFGEVLSTKHIPSSTCRALKIIKKNQLSHSELESGIAYRESLILSNLNHNNIIKFYEMLEDDHNFYIITELCEGGNLKEKLKKSYKFTEETTLEIMKQIIEAVEYLHSQNLVHRDIKLENILLTDLSSNKVKIADFGVSDYIQSGQILKDDCGSLYYLAPEVINGYYTEKVDIWSCGILALILLTGTYPYSGKSSAEIKDKIKMIKSDELLGKISNISLETQDLIRKMLEIDTSKRITAENAKKHNCFNKI